MIRGGRTWRSGARLAPCLALACALSSCANDVRGLDVPDGVVVATYRAPQGALAARRTFAIASKVGVVSDGGSAPSPVESPLVVASVVAHLEGRGFVKAAEIDPAAPPMAPVAADLAVNLTALESSRTEQAYWLGSPGHAAPAAWGYPGYAWAYAWEWAPVAPSRGTVVIEVTDLASAAAGGDPGASPLAVGWAAFAFAVAPEATSYDAPEVLEAIDRAFSQSPYLVAAP